MGTSNPSPNGAMGVSNLIVGTPTRHERGLDLPASRPSSRVGGNGGNETGASQMSVNGTSSQLLFFDTFSHEVIEELNLDLVQFPSPVIVDEVRIIPLGARVQANFAGGVRLGATNPTRFDLECFVNDLSTPGASTFEPLGVLHYDHHARIHLRPSEYNGSTGANVRKIPTDGLVLRGFYNAITLAVYGTLSKSTAEQLAQAAQNQNTAANEESVQNVTNDVSVPTASPTSRSTENHSNLVSTKTSNQGQPAQYPNASEGQHAPSWAAAETQQASHDTMVANWASSAAANLEQHQVPTNTTSTSSLPSPLNDANINSTRSKLDEKHETSDNMQTGQHIESLKQVTSEDSRSNKVGEIRHGQQLSHSNEKSNYQERDYRTRNHSSGDCQPNSPKQRLSEERSGRLGRDLDTSSTRGRSHTPASRSRSPHSAHNISVSPDSRSGRNRNDRTPTPINGYENHIPTRAQNETSLLMNTVPESTSPSKNQQPDSIAEGDILDDVSDISEGDIPDIPALGDDENKEGQHTLPIDTASSEQAITENSECNLKLVKEDDIEEISDEEAEWSDDGDCMLPLDFEMDLEATEEEWEEPIKIFDYFSTTEEIKQPLKYITLLTFSEDSALDKHTEELKKSYESTEANNDVKPEAPLVKQIISTLQQLQCSGSENKRTEKCLQVGSDWVELIEKLTALISKDFDKLVKLDDAELKVILESLKIGLSIDKASEQPQPTYKVRHLKSSLKLLYEIIYLEQRNNNVHGTKFISTKNLFLHGDLQQALLKLFHNTYAANTIRLLVLKIIDLVLNSSVGFELLINRNTKYETRTSKTFLEELLMNASNATSSSRIRFALASLNAKINFIESLKTLSSLAVRLSQKKEIKDSNYENMEEIVNCVNQISSFILDAKRIIAQPKSSHFLPLTKFISQQNERKNCSGKVSEKSTNYDLIDPYPGIFSLMQSNRTLNAILIFMANPIISASSNVSAAVKELLSVIIHHPVGMVYLNGGAIDYGERYSDQKHFQTLNTLCRILLQQTAAAEADEHDGINQSEKNGQDVGLQLIYSIHALKLIDRLYCLCNGIGDRRDLEQMEILNTIQALYGMTFTISGKLTLTRLLTTGKTLDILIRFAQHSGELKEGNSSVTKKDMKRSAIRGYACELLLLVVRTSENVSYLNNFATELIALGRADETSKLHELIAWVSPIEHIKIEASFLSSLCEVVKNNSENVSPMSRELVTAVRAINNICSSDTSTMKHQSYLNSINKDQKVYQLPSLDANLISLYSQGLIELYLAILEKICGYHEQPHLHVATFVGYNGYVLLSVIKPVVQTLAIILGHLISCQDNDYRDTNPINVLLRTFTLCYVVPRSSSCYDLSQSVCSDILRIMLAFTSTSFIQPSNTVLEMCRKESSGYELSDSGRDVAINKPINNGVSIANTAMWQKMIAEMIKYTLSAPHTYLAGLRIFSEVLPVPLPIPTKIPFSHEESDKVENIRRLWSVRVYGCETLVKEMVIKLGGIGASCSTLGHLLRRVCVQLADLSPPTAKIITEALIDGIKLYQDSRMRSQPTLQTPDSSQLSESLVKEKIILCAPETSRILNLLMWLVSNGSVKAAFIEVTSNSHSTELGDSISPYEGFLSVLMQMLNTFPSKSEGKDRQALLSHALSQEYILGIVQMLLDPEISLLPIVQDPEVSNISEKHLANSLPPHDHYVECLKGLFEHISAENIESGFSILSSAIRTLIMITYQDFGLSKLKSLLLEKPNAIYILLKKLDNIFDANSKLTSDCFNTLTAISELLRIIIGMVPCDEPTTEGSSDNKSRKTRDSYEKINTTSKRVISLTKKEVLKIFNWCKVESQAIKHEPDADMNTSVPRSFTIGSLVGSLQKENLQADSTAAHPLISLELSLSKLIDTKVVQKVQELSETEVEQVAESQSVENGAGIIWQQISLTVQQLNTFVEDISKDMEVNEAVVNTDADLQVNLASSESILGQFKQRAVFEFIRESSSGPVSYRGEEMDCAQLDTDEVNEDERLNTCYWNVLSLEESNNIDNDNLISSIDPEHNSNESLINVNLIELSSCISTNPSEPFDLLTQVRQVCDEKSLFETEASKLKKKPKKSLLEAKALANKKLISTFNAGGTVPGLPTGRGRGFHRTSGQRLDAFRSRPANTSRPPSLHVDDFLLLQMRGQQPTGPTGYNRQSVKAAQELFAEREAKSKGAMVGFRDVTKQPVYCDDGVSGIAGVPQGLDKPHHMNWNMRGRMRGSSGFIRGQGRGGFNSFSSGRGSWNTYHRSEYGRTAVAPGSSTTGMNQERRYSLSDSSGNNTMNSNRRSSDRSSKDRSSGVKSSSRR